MTRKRDDAADWRLNMVSHPNVAFPSAEIEIAFGDVGLTSFFEAGSEDCSPFHFRSFRFPAQTDPAAIERLRTLLIPRTESFLLTRDPPEVSGANSAAFFDADMTLFQAEVIDLLGELAGKKNEMEAITRRAMEGKMDFDESISLRVGMLRGLKSREAEEVAAKVRLTPGVPEMLRLLRERGWKIVVISGGFSSVIRAVLEREDLPFDAIFAHELETGRGELTGKVLGEAVNRTRKREIAERFRKRENINPRRTLACGDGYNDGEMLRAAAAGFGLMPKKKLMAGLHAAIRQPDLRLMAVLLGWGNPPEEGRKP